jgi:hypothetical protein
MSVVRLPPVAALALLVWSPLEAQTQPQLVPTRDVDITYTVTRAHGPAVRERVRWSAAEHLERVDGPDRSTTIFDRKSSEITLLIPGSRTYRKLEGARMLPIEPEKDAILTRGGEAKVAGLGCTDWSWTENGQTRTACVTPDGVLLRSTVDGKTVVQALSVSYHQQSADLFEVPRGYAPALAPEGGAEP